MERIARAISERPEGNLVELREEDGQLVACTERGNRFGTLRQGERSGLRAGAAIAVQGALASDGNLRVILSGEE